jgi:predicted GNAT family acetyltransferase
VSTPEITVADAPERGQFEIALDGAPAGFAAYQRLGRVIAFTHTEVDGSFEGHGLGGRLISFALDSVREAGMDVLPYCPFVRSYIERHPDYLDLVPPRRRAEFGLPAEAS